MTDHDSSQYVPADESRLPSLSVSQVHAAQLTVAEYAVQLPRAELVDLLNMLGIHPATPYTEQETTNG